MRNELPIPIPPRSPDSPRENKSNFIKSIHNRFDIEVIDSITGKVKQKAKAENIVLNQYWKYFTSGISYLAYGSGSGTPTATRTSLFNQINAKSPSTKNSSVDYKSCVYSRTYYITLSETENVGVSLTEVGLRKSSYLVTHAMITDMNGNPISIKKTDTDIITIYATVFVHFNASGYQGGTMFLTDVTNILSGCIEGLSASTDNCIFYMGNMWTTAWDSYWSKWPKAFLSYSPDLTQENAQSATVNLVFNRLPVGSGNHEGGICAMMYGYERGIYTASQYLFMLPKSPSRILGEALGTGDGTTKNFKTEFSLPFNATIYVDGVAQNSGVVVVPNLSTSADFSRFLVPLHSDSNPNAIIVDATTNYQYSCSKEVMMYYNHYHDLVAIESFTIKGNNRSLFVSNDLENWISLGKTGSTTALQKLQVPTEYSKYKYWKVVSNGEGLSSSYEIWVSCVDFTGYSVRFEVAPPLGSVLTIDYDTPMIPKNANHVFDMRLSISAGGIQEV